MENVIWRSRASVWLGVLVASLPFLSFPQEFKTPIFVIFGLLIALFNFAQGHYALNYKKDKEASIKTVADFSLEIPTKSKTNVIKNSVSNAPEMDKKDFNLSADSINNDKPTKTNIQKPDL